ncbi:MAG: HAD family phosphatase [Firmicutes bacterium]|nr:HAD family phosphatase [Bacillota bacterium]
MSYKMLCLDIDGTLLNSNHKISSKTREAVRLVSGRIPVILVSARMPAGIFPYQKELGLNEAVISYSGALILDEKRNVLLNKTISTSIVELLYDNFMGQVHLSIYCNNDWYIENKDCWVRQEKEITGLTPLEVNYRKLIDNWYRNSGGANKLLCMGEEGDITVLYHQLQKMIERVTASIAFYRSKSSYLEIMDKAASKAAAIEKLAANYGVERNEIIAIGDNYNDLNMIEYAGLGVAMGNAPEAVKEQADEITSSNDNDGVARIIYKYFN